MKIKLFGFEQVRKFVSNIAQDIENIRQEPMRQLGLRGERLAKEHLQKQDLGWKPLSPEYLKYKQKGRKGKRKLSEKTLIATSSYFQSITSYTTRSQVAIGVLRGVRNEDGQEIANIARIHEYGSTKRKIPARPLWQPVLEELKTHIVTSNPFIRAARIYFKRKYGF